LDVAAGLDVTAGLAAVLGAEAALPPDAAGLGATCVLAGDAVTARFGAAVSAAFAASIRAAADAAQHSKFRISEPLFYKQKKGRVRARPLEKY
jgi:hypothetical protein